MRACLASYGAKGPSRRVNAGEYAVTEQGSSLMVMVELSETSLVEMVELSDDEGGSYAVRYVELPVTLVAGMRPVPPPSRPLSAPVPPPAVELTTPGSCIQETAD